MTDDSKDNEKKNIVEEKYPTVKWFEGIHKSETSSPFVAANIPMPLHQATQ